MNRKFISKSNRVLRNVLNSKKNLDIIQDFIETFLKIKIQEIKLNSYLKIRSKYLPKEENFGIADVRIKTSQQEELNIGIQFVDGYYAQNKMLLYYAQIHANQLEYQDNRKIAKTITFNLLDFNYLKSEQYFNKISIASKAQNTIELYVLELRKYKREEEKKLDSKEAWMTYLCGKKEDEIEKVLKTFDAIRKLDKLLDKYWKEEVME